MKTMDMALLGLGAIILLRPNILTGVIPQVSEKLSKIAPLTSSLNAIPTGPSDPISQIAERVGTTFEEAGPVAPLVEMIKETPVDEPLPILPSPTVIYSPPERLVTAARTYGAKIGPRPLPGPAETCTTQKIAPGVMLQRCSVTGSWVF